MNDSLIFSPGHQDYRHCAGLTDRSGGSRHAHKHRIHPAACFLSNHLHRMPSHNSVFMHKVHAVHAFSGESLRQPLAPVSLPIPEFSLIALSQSDSQIRIYLTSRPKNVCHRNGPGPSGTSEKGGPMAARSVDVPDPSVNKCR